MAKVKDNPSKIKIPTVRQLPSGSWFCQLRINGQSISITDEDYDTVVAKAYAYKAGLIKAKKAPKDITVGEALAQYIESRRNVLSPSTVCGYQTIKRTRFLALQTRRLSTLTKNIIQRDINNESLLCSPKTLHNSYMLLSSAIVEAGGEKYDVRLPQVPPSNKKYLTPEQIPLLLEAAKGTKFEIAILLGLWSCRRSEIFGLTWDNVDLQNRTIRIFQSVVPDEDYKYVDKPMPKNNSSVRTIPISDQLYDALSKVEDKTGHVVKGNLNSLYKAVNRLCDQLSLPRIGAHGLRHSLFTNTRGVQIHAAEYSFHFQTQWRFRDEKAILLTTKDIYEPYRENVSDDWQFDLIDRADSQSSVFDVKSKALICKMQDSIVIDCQLSAANDLSITFSNGIIFEQFMSASKKDEEWRLINYKNNTHLVCYGEDGYISQE